MIFQRINKSIFMIIGFLYGFILLYSLLAASFHFADWFNFVIHLSIADELREAIGVIGNIENVWSFEFGGNLLDNIIEVVKAVGQTLSNLVSMAFSIIKIMFYAPLKDFITLLGLILGAF